MADDKTMVDSQIDGVKLGIRPPSTWEASHQIVLHRWRGDGVTVRRKVLTLNRYERPRGFAEL